MLGYSFDALPQPIRQLAAVTSPTHGLVHLVQDSETSGQPRKIGLVIRREDGIGQRRDGGREREAGQDRRSIGSRVRRRREMSGKIHATKELWASYRYSLTPLYDVLCQDAYLLPLLDQLW